jgi:hypothetical protein
MDPPRQRPTVRTIRKDPQHPRPEKHGRSVHPGGGRDRGRDRTDRDRDGLQEAPDQETKTNGAGQTRRRQVERRSRGKLARVDTNSKFSKFSDYQKRKTLRASATTQRRIKSNGVNDPATISLAVDKYQRIGGAERAWPGDSDIRQRRVDDSGGVQPVPRYLPAYTSDVSHLIV